MEGKPAATEKIGKRGTSAYYGGSVWNLLRHLSHSASGRMCCRDSYIHGVEGRIICKRKWLSNQKFIHKLVNDDGPVTPY